MHCTGAFADHGEEKGRYLGKVLLILATDDKHFEYQFVKDRVSLHVSLFRLIRRHLALLLLVDDLTDHLLHELGSDLEERIAEDLLLR